jgi:phosphoesterase RecJ-like protein
MLNRIREAILSANKLLITSHINPDGDAIGSQLALYGALTQLGKQVSIINSSPVPVIYRFLPFAHVIQHMSTIRGEYDLVCVLDCAELSRAGEMALTGKTIMINIDHHYNPTPFGDLNWQREDACSTAELIFELIKGLEVKPDVAISTNIYTGIITDTGSFHFDNTTARSLALASQLVELGANPRYIAEQIYESLPLSTIKLLGSSLGQIELCAGGLIASITITRNMLNQSGARDWETENLINFPKSIEGVRVAILFHQIENGYYKVSMRSKGEINVARIAGEFNGGGHFHAAGCRIQGELVKVKARVIECVNNFLSSSSPE